MVPEAFLACFSVHCMLAILSYAFCLCFLEIQGYLFISVLVNSNSELIRLINNAIKNDLASRNPTFMGLALHCIANVGSREMAEAFAGEIPKILVAGYVSGSYTWAARASSKHSPLCITRGARKPYYRAQSHRFSP